MRRPGRTSALAAVSLGLLALGVVARARWPDAKPSLDCPPEAVRLDSAGLATCGPGTVPTGARALALGLKLDLNAASEAELALVPGVGPDLARRLVMAREEQGRFTSWDDVDAVPGVGSAKLQTLRAATVLESAAATGSVW
ncbi:helix-hairpin-helix domain-containing protein [Corallococcus praedator]|uniref:Helix-hairpin-helix domain-containing protein n=1 Tax=Corallococcus praedator TaxID=2316724 RepID=A0ABX9Q9R0_9BACT|nr:helix-hairpin-helix domain-containing protein [Corallococcus sp. CA031C]RKH95975.1 helix-hairpin-helix domain-containing protein [Corallococcus praedator]